MTGSEISRKLGISRQSVSQTLKSAMKKIYIQVMQDKNLAESPFEAVLTIMSMLNVDKDASTKDVSDFFELFPNEIKKEIQFDATRRFNV